jgi:hypothetical protein
MLAHYIQNKIVSRSEIYTWNDCCGITQRNQFSSCPDGDCQSCSHPFSSEMPELLGKSFSLESFLALFRNQENISRCDLNAARRSNVFWIISSGNITSKYHFHFVFHFSTFDLLLSSLNRSYPLLFVFFQSIEEI